MSDIYTIYSTFPERNEAVFVARSLLERGLIACANVVDNVTSVYRWEGKVTQENEVILFAKTSQEKCDAAIALIDDLHSYELPCIVATKIEAGFAPFLEWVKEEVA